MRRIRRLLGIGALFAALTALTQIGGLAYLFGLTVGCLPGLRGISPVLRRTTTILAGTLVYVVFTAVVVPPLATSLGRVRLPCHVDGEGPVVAATPLTCVLNRGYVRPEVRDLLMALGTEAGRRFPGTQLTALEGNFPFGNGFPLLPHLSHQDGKRVDVAYFYEDAAGSIGHGSPSPIGYFVYEQPRTGDRLPCSGRWTPLRWNFAWLQPDPPRWRLDQQRTAWMVEWLKNNPSVSRLFLEPHLADRLGVASGKVRFQGCQAARHDDHIHIDVP